MKAREGCRPFPETKCRCSLNLSYIFFWQWSENGQPFCIPASPLPIYIRWPISIVQRHLLIKKSIWYDNKIMYLANILEAWEGCRLFPKTNTVVLSSHTQWLSVLRYNPHASTSIVGNINRLYMCYFNLTFQGH